MKTILVPISEEVPKDKVLQYIRLIANKSSYKILLFHIVSLSNSAEFMKSTDPINDDALIELRKREEIENSSFVEQLKADGYEVEIWTPLGLFDEKFVSAANEVDPAFILMLTSGSQNILETILGTQTSSILEKIKSPILVIPFESDLKEFKQALVALHLDDDELNVLKAYFQFAEEHQLTSNFVKIDENFEINIIDDELILKKINELYPGKIEFIVHRESEDVAEGLEKYAIELGSDLIVLFATRRNFIEKLFHDSITKEMVMYSKNPLLIFHH